MWMRWFILTFFAMFASLEAVSAIPPTRVDAKSFGIYGGNMVPTTLSLTAAEETELLTRLKQFKFASYLRSACAERAHAAYLLAPPHLHLKLMKIWLASPSTYTAAIGSKIKPIAQPASGKPVEWDFHVALAYRTSAGIRVYDAGLAQGRALTLEEWYALMELPDLTVALTTDAKVYGFNQIKTDDLSPNKLTWNGNFYLYQGNYYTEAWIPRALARDVIAEAAVDGKGCGPIRDLTGDPALLQSFLSGINLPQGWNDQLALSAKRSECRSDIEAFEVEKARWIRLLEVQP